MTEEDMSPESGDVRIATTTAQGADCSFRRDHQHRIAKSPLLLARTLRPKLSRFDRRICLRFDLTDWPTADAAKVRLQLTAAPSGKGFASQSTDTIIAAYGIVDDTLDHWSPDKVSWEELPGVIDDPSQSDIVRLLGRFTIPKGRQSGNFRVEGRELTVSIDGKVAASLSSAAIGHATKDNFRVEVKPSFVIDGIKVSKTDATQGS